MYINTISLSNVKNVDYTCQSLKSTTHVQLEYLEIQIVLIWR
jgi:hypothetical protein